MRIYLYTLVDIRAICQRSMLLCLFNFPFAIQLNYSSVVADIRKFYFKRLSRVQESRKTTNGNNLSAFRLVLNVGKIDCILNGSEIDKIGRNTQTKRNEKKNTIRSERILSLPHTKSAKNRFLSAFYIIILCVLYIHILINARDFAKSNNDIKQI